ncbi:WD repeat domain-containing protein 83 [Eurytemora carolleeae]|uniref:WD repeat domain-containing protein 83 n=1 Tax=Eurytemora carolleeae TaxID=1294199 RepID=UPI000C766959|nr:WD repeat domain-containing protein 83 [Eurytemora carolleeae]|eukprot:XP_023347673.1 WD repeat domain-containing protein 83-like [Eurytemora affinis]
MECGPQLKPEEPEYPDIPKARIREVDCKQGAIRCVRFSVDGNYCMTGGADKSLKLWNPNRGSLLKTYMGHGYEILDCQGSCDNSQLVSCSMDKSVVLWDVTSGNFTRKWRGHQASVNCVRFNEECTVVMSGSVDTCVKIWDTKSRSQEPIQTLEDSKDNVTSMDVSDHEILVGSADKHFRNYDLRMGSVVSDYVGDTVSCVRFTRDGQCILVSAVSSSLKLFDKTTGEMLQEFMGHINKDYRLECCMDFSDKYVLSGSENAQVYIWDLVEGGCVAKLDHLNLGAVHSLAPHPSTAQLLTGAQGTLTVWDTGEEEEEMEQEPVLSSSSVYDSKPHWM